MKKISSWWSLLVGVLSPLAQIAIFFSRFGRFPADANVLDYVWFFLAGVAGGYALILFLNRASAMKARWIVIVGFLLATPLALIMMVGGGLFSFVGVVLLPLIPWAGLSWLGLALGNWLSKS